MKRHSRVFLVIGCLAFSSFVMGEVYRWTDDKGKVHFGDKPPTTGAEPIKVKPSKGIGKMDTPSNAQDFREIQKKMVNSYDEKQKLKKEKEAKQKQEEQKRLAECKKIKKDYLTLEGPRVYTVDDKGERVYLSDEEVQQEKDKAKQWMDEHCQGVN